MKTLFYLLILAILVYIGIGALNAGKQAINGIKANQELNFKALDQLEK